MTDSRSSPGAGPSVCPFVALAEDRNRRADTPDEGNRCYAEPAPRQRDMAYQADYCYSPDFAACSVFLAWAARNAAEPAYVTEAAQKAWSSGIALPEDGGSSPPGTDDADELPAPTPEGGLFGPLEPDEPGQATGSDQLDWVSAGAWAEAPWDERAEMEADELEDLEAEELEEEEPEESLETPEEATQAPKVPAALPMRRRKPPQAPIKSRGSGEWHYADPPGHEPLVRRRAGITAPVMLGVLALLVASIIVFLVATQIGGGGEQQSAAAPSPSLDASSGPVATRAPVVTAAPSLEPSPTPAPAIRTYTVKEGDLLSLIAARPRFKVSVQQLQCINRIRNPNIIQPGQVLRIPPDEYECPKGWRKSTPEPIE